jgi:branched-chain amino acid transport system substrate-binding protein
VALGQVGTFSGLVGPIFGAALLATAAWAKDVNARGGLACHPVTLYVREDGGDPARAAAAVRELIDTRKVAALVGNQTALSGAGFFPEVKKACTPAVGLEYGPDWTNDPCLFPQGGGYYEQLAGMVKEAVNGGRTKLGLLYCVEIGACGAAGKLIEESAKRFGAELAYSSPVSLTQPDFTAQCQNAKNAAVVELIVALEGSAMARLARSCLALNYKPLLSGTGLAVNPEQASDPKLRELGLIGVIANAPWFTDQPGLKELRDVIAQYAPQAKLTGSLVAVWASVKLLEAGVARIGAAARTGPLTAPMVLSGMNKVRGETLGGLTAPLDFTPAHKGMRTSGCVFFARLDAAGWTDPLGGKPLCNVLPKEAS